MTAIEHHTKPKIGDRAWHKDGLDPREVIRIEGKYIGLRIGNTEAWPCPAKNYTYTTPEKNRGPR